MYGRRVRKDHPTIEANGAVDEAQAAIGVARAETERESELDQILVGVERDLWVLMAELATAPEDRPKLEVRKTLVTKDMVQALEERIDDLKERTDVPAEFVVPGQDRLSALLDQARTVVRRAERLVVAAHIELASDHGDDHGGMTSGSYIGQYLNRLSDLIWTTARWQEGEHELAKKPPGAKR